MHTVTSVMKREFKFLFFLSGCHILTGFYVKPVMLKTRHVHSAPLLSLC